MQTSPNCSTQKSRRTWKALVSWFQTLTAPGMKTRMYSFNASMPPNFCTQVSSKINFVRGSSSLPVKAVELLSVPPGYTQDRQTKVLHSRTIAVGTWTESASSSKIANREPVDWVEPVECGVFSLRARREFSVAFAFR